MTAVAAPQPAPAADRVAPPAAAAPARPWLYGPVPDLLLGCGLAYVGFFFVLAAAGDGVRRLVPYELSPLLALATGAPHYGATLLRVYERREDRRAYLLFTLHLTVLVWALFVACLHSPWLGSLVLTVYLTWSPWHYTGQNYGIAMLFLRRRGVPVSSRAKQLVYASFVLSFLLTAVVIHTAQHGVDYAPVSYANTAYEMIPLGIPGAVAKPLVVVLALAWAGSLLASAVVLGRVASAAALLPSACLALSQALWFAVPVIAREVGWMQGIDPLSTTHAAYTFLWIAAAHSVQYLWVSSYFAKTGGRAASQTGYYARTLLAGAGIWVVPALLFAPGVLGALPYDSGLAVMVAAAVNLHHFLLDGAIWKLRDGRVARVLLRGAGPESAIAPPRGPRLWPAVAAAGVVSVLVLGYGTVEQELVRQAVARGDLARAESGIARLAWLGRDGPGLRIAYAHAAAAAGRHAEARAHAERALALRPSAESWRALGSVEQQAGRLPEALRAYQEALGLRPGWPPAANDLAWIRATSPDASLRDPPEAVRLAEAAARDTGLRDPAILDTLAAAYAASLRFRDAVATAERAAAAARAAGQDALASDVETRLAGYREGRVARSAAAAPAPPPSAP